ncbi:MAG: fumarate hydratase [Dehalococcoidia bacterium]|nr:MAG: fumarate hydratase [Dehalococcoidia bacterium]
MREIDVKEITKAVSQLFQEACYYLPEDVLNALKQARQTEESPIGCNVLDRIIENVDISAKEQIPICGDTGVAVVFLEIGQDIHIVGGDIYCAINEGVRQGYAEGYLRKSMVSQPFSARTNTGDNTPAMIHTDIVPGDKLKIVALPKGAGSENMACLAMLSPAQGRQGVIDFVVNAVDKAGSNPCPPHIVGVGIGGTVEKTIMLAKRALLRRVGEPNPGAEVADLETEILARVNRLGIGPAGYGGRATALAVHVEVFPSHIASLPVAVNIQCWCARQKVAIL